MLLVFDLARNFAFYGELVFCCAFGVVYAVERLAFLCSRLFVAACDDYGVKFAVFDLVSCCRPDDGAVYPVGVYCSSVADLDYFDPVCVFERC